MNETLPRKDWIPAADNRCAATVIDVLFAFPCMLPVSPVMDGLARTGMPWWLLGILTVLVWVAFTIIVFAAFESSRLRGTPGKLICGIAVVGADGSPLTFRQALHRNAIKYSLAALGLAPLFKKQWAPDGAIHDAVYGSSVISRKESNR